MPGAEMAALTERISAERDKMVRQVEGLFGPLAADWQELCGSLIHGHEHWQVGPMLHLNMS